MPVSDAGLQRICIEASSAVDPDHSTGEIVASCWAPAAETTSGEISKQFVANKRRWYIGRVSALKLNSAATHWVTADGIVSG